MWLRDQLAHDMKTVRVILYGHDTQLLNSQSVQSIDNLAVTFIESLRSIGRAHPLAKPAIIMAHSLGGIVLKSALLELARSQQGLFLDAICGIIAFGVPNRGMRISHLMSMVEGKPNEQLIRDISHDSVILWYHEFAKNSHSLCIRDTKNSGCFGKTICCKLL